MNTHVPAGDNGTKLMHTRQDIQVRAGTDLRRDFRSATDSSFSEPSRRCYASRCFSSRFPESFLAVSPRSIHRSSQTRRVNLRSRSDTDALGNRRCPSVETRANVRGTVDSYRVVLFKSHRSGISRSFVSYSRYYLFNDIGCAVPQISGSGTTVRMYIHRIHIHAYNCNNSAVRVIDTRVSDYEVTNGLWSFIFFNFHILVRDSYAATCSSWLPSLSSSMWPSVVVVAVDLSKTRAARATLRRRGSFAY